MLHSLKAGDALGFSLIHVCVYCFSHNMSSPILHFFGLVSSFETSHLMYMKNVIFNMQQCFGDFFFLQSQFNISIDYPQEGKE